MELRSAAFFEQELRRGSGFLVVQSLETSAGIVWKLRKKEELLLREG
jgi:hypothetical protein